MSKLKHLDPTARYWVDDMGYLWCGPVEGGHRGYKYLRYEGVTATGRPSWRWRSKFLPPGAEEYTPAQADGIVDLYLYHARVRRQQGKVD